MATPSRDDDDLPSLIDFGDGFKPEPSTPSHPLQEDSSNLRSSSSSSGGEALPTPDDFQGNAFYATPYKPQHSPDLLTGDFTVTPPTTIPGVYSATETSRWTSENPFDHGLETPFVASGGSSNSHSASTSSPSFDPPTAKPSSGHVRHSQSTPELKTATTEDPATAITPPQLESRVSAPPPKGGSGTPSSVSPSSRGAWPSEFIAAGGGRGIYKPPARGPVDPDRPVPFDLRPSPTRTLQVARAIVYVNGAVWVACDGAMKVWNVENAMAEGSAGEGNPPDDVDAAQFSYIGLEGSITHCLVADAANKLVWSGHRDGRVRAWSAESSTPGALRAEPRLCWVAHRSPILSMVITPYGELWTGSDAGTMRAWPWEVASHCLATDDPLTAAATIARSYIDLKARGTAAGAASLVNTDVHFLVADHTNGRVWSGGPLLFAMWDARTRDVLKVFGPSVQSEFSSPDISPVRDNMWDDDLRSSRSKKEKAGSTSFLQRVIGAADAVRRAAGGQTGDNSKRLEALVAAVDGTVWGGYVSGMLVQWDGLGNRLQEATYIPVPVRCLFAVGTRLWVGYADGRIQVLSDTGKVLGVWIANSSAIIHMTKGGGHVFTLAAHGGIRGWNMGSPCPIDGILQIEMQSKADSYTQHRNFKVLAGTWNVAEERASLKSMQMWLSAGASEAGVVFVGLQETEMGAGALAMAAAKETVGIQEKGSANGQWWLDNLGAAIGEDEDFVRVGSRQLAGILIGVWVRNELIPYVSEVDAAAVPCGFGRALGNKGGVAVKLMLYRRTFCFLSSHFAAHMDAVGRRNADFEHIYQQMKFGRSSAAPVYRGAAGRRTASPEAQELTKEMVDSEAALEAMLPDLADADMIVWVGDFNYRIDDLSYEDVLDFISVKQWDALLPKDQLRTEMAAGRVFPGMREGHVCFQPTYKFDKGYNHVLGYDSSEKRRVPAWCDRVIFRDSFDGTDAKKGNLSHPVSASVILYDACTEVVDSDHKPVRCLINVDVAVINEATRRRAFFDLMKSNSHVQKWMEHLNVVPETVISTNKIILEDGVPCMLKAINESARQAVVFELQCEGETADASSASTASVRAAYGLPLWLQVVPASGVIPPHGNVDITLKFMNVLADDFAEGGRAVEDSRGKVVKLAFHYRGPLSSVNKRYQVVVSSPSAGPGSQERGEKFWLQRSNVLASRLNSTATKDLLL